jgi:chromosome segregation ATPase
MEQNKNNLKSEDKRKLKKLQQDFKRFNYLLDDINNNKRHSNRNLDRYKRELASLEMKFTMQIPRLKILLKSLKKKSRK